jgi:nucleoside-diphosphate-sugar epimerase
MADKKLIAVIGATGSQGSSVLEYLLNSGNYRVRGLTRDPTKAICSTSKTKWGNDLEWIKCDAENADELIKAFEGCFGAFCVTDFWQDPNRMIEEEFNIGRVMIDSAVEAKLKICVVSVLHNVQNISEGTLTVPHFTNKAKIETYAKTEFGAIDTAFAFVYPGFYMNNFLILPGMSLKVNDEGLLTNDPLPIKATTKLPIIHINEFGGFVLPIFNDIQRFKNQRVFAFNGYATMPELIGMIAETLNLKSKYTTNTYDEFYQASQNVELVHMMKWFDEYGYYGGDNTNFSVPFNKLLSLQDAVKTIDWSSFNPSMFQRVGEKITQVKDTIVDTAERMKEKWTTEQAQ